MEKELFEEYGKVMARFDGNQDAQDIIQTRMEYLTMKCSIDLHEKTGKPMPYGDLARYTSTRHFNNSLNWYVKKRQIRIDKKNQQNENLVSFDAEGNQFEKDIPALVHVPKDYHLYKHMINQFKTDKKTGLPKRIWTTRQLKVIAKRYLSGKTQVEIASEIGVSQKTISKLYNKIDKTILTLDLKDNVSHWYNGSGATKADIWQISHKASGPVNNNPEPLPERETRKPEPMPNIRYIAPVSINNLSKSEIIKLRECYLANKPKIKIKHMKNRYTLSIRQPCYTDYPLTKKQRIAKKQYQNFMNNGDIGHLAYMRELTA